MATPIQPANNRLLASMSTDTATKLRPHLHRVRLSMNQTLYAAGARITHAYFPIDCAISLVHTSLEGATSETGLVGNEGMFGIPLLLESATSPHETVVQGAGEAFKISAPVILERIAAIGELATAIKAYAAVFVSQIGQTAACNSIHKLEPRICRWILMMLDRAPSENLQLTHSFLARMLGVHRENVSRAIPRLKANGAITYERGKLKVLDREILESCVCECYWTIKDEEQKLLPWMRDKKVRIR